MDTSLERSTLALFWVSATRKANDPDRLASCGEGVRFVPKKEIYDKLSIYIPQRKMGERPVERLIKLGEKHDRSINYLVVDAILQYLEREENRS
jgi:hypothetical protein